MDKAKADRLKRELADVPPEQQLVSLERFFDGNDDEGSIGCNLLEHPGVATFRDVLGGVVRLPGVERVYVEISELDPGPDCWPFSERILVVGELSVDALRDAVAVLKPDEVWVMEPDEVPATITEQQRRAKVLAVWWD